MRASSCGRRRGVTTIAIYRAEPQDVPFDDRPGLARNATSSAHSTQRSNGRSWSRYSSEHTTPSVSAIASLKFYFKWIERQATRWHLYYGVLWRNFRRRGGWLLSMHEDSLCK